MFKKIILVLCLPLTLAGCSLSLTASPTQNQGGVYKSTDNGFTWVQQATVVLPDGKLSTLGNLDANVIGIDPSDAKALYYGSVGNGLFYSLDAAGSFAEATALGPINIQAMAVDPNTKDARAKCVVYAASQNRLLKTVDCARTWTQVYFDNDTGVLVSQVAVDGYNDQLVYLTTDKGTLLKSVNGGGSWSMVKQFNDKIIKLVINPNDTRELFVATAGNGLWHSANQGGVWDSLQGALKTFPDSNSVRDLAIAKSNPGVILLATNYGLLKSIDHGKDWTSIQLIAPQQQANINSVAISNNDVKQIFYVTDNALYATTDGGTTWAARQLPTTRPAGEIIIDQKNQGTLYLVTKVKSS